MSDGRTLRVGDRLVYTEGCLNYFGRNFYWPARVEAVGADWVVVRDEYGVVWLASSIRPEELLEQVEDHEYRHC